MQCKWRLALYNKFCQVAVPLHIEACWDSMICVEHGVYKGDEWRHLHCLSCAVIYTVTMLVTIACPAEQLWWAVTLFFALHHLHSVMACSVHCKYPCWFRTHLGISSTYSGWVSAKFDILYDLPACSSTIIKYVGKFQTLCHLPRPLFNLIFFICVPMST